jgi:hypothetical protein
MSSKDIIVPLFLLLFAGLMYAVNERVTRLAHEVEKGRIIQSAHHVEINALMNEVWTLKRRVLHEAE